ncbi:MAG: bifunctional UDP-N-acetylglucosamine diphosphorylase/glucosamine-1-phosphate N-acetyltransferase GlmU [Firmicutes bacterium]|nr:bifunctional UDP-N-acetylglucosamine diphosphorylase/glucosamine-1-phosphate N-acetyltransferase GlmU [Bacillota bacterium]
MDFSCIILAAGQGTRMKSTMPKVLHKVCGRALVEHVLTACSGTGKPAVVIGNGSEMVRGLLGDSVRYAMQEQRKGTGHAVMECFRQLDIDTEYTLVCAGDMPLITAQTLQELCKRAEGLGACVLSACMDNPFGYGRIIRNQDGTFKKIVEQKDATAQEAEVREVNTSVYVFRTELLRSALKQITPANAQGEYYLTDCLEIISREAPIGVMCLDDPDEAFGINDRVQLAQAEAIMRRRINCGHMKNGVTLTDPDNTYIEAGVSIGADTVIYPGSYIGTGTVIGSRCVLRGANRIENSVIGDGVSVEASTLLSCRVGDGTTVGPNAYLRPGAVIGRKARIGDFVEIKNASVGDGSKVSHLSYVGDADVGSGCNIGCGVVFVNYDGKHKFRSVVGDRVFVGSNANIVAPVHLADGAYIAAGSTVTRDIPSGALCVARSREYIKEEWADKLRASWEEEEK